MKTFTTNSGLEFHGIDFKNPTGADNYFGKKYISEINSWKSPKIDQFIINTKFYGPVGDFLKDSSTLDDRDLYVIFDRQEIVATSLLVPNSPLLGSKELGFYVSKTMLGDEFNGYLNLANALKLLSNPIQNNFEIAYLIVKPKRFNQGYGKQTVCDICENIDIISNGEPQICAFTQINKLNKPSIHVFEDNGFATVPSDGEFNYYYKLLPEEKELLD